MKRNSKPKASSEKLLLVSAPWPLYSRPSIQIGTLKAFLGKKIPDLKVDAHHFYLKVAEAVGYRHYQAVSERVWLAETVYAALLYPERADTAEKIFYRQAKGKPLLQKIVFKNLVSQVREVSEAFIQSVDWGDYILAGFSICLCQLTASLYLIREVKKRFSNLSIVVGGSIFTGDATQNLFKTFPEINIVVNGEGELPLSRLVFHLRKSRRIDKMLPIKGIVTPESAGYNRSPIFNQMADLSDLSPPDYDDYFDLLQSFSPGKTFFPTLPMEMSRGCWWRRPFENGKSTGCAFCNLNLQWEGYRAKKPTQTVSEIDHLTTKYKTLSVAFMDNLLPLKTSKEIFTGIGKLKKDLHLFGEIRATTPRHILADMQIAGMKEVQIGIEALSTRLLRKLNKGTTAIQNLEIMKHCETLGISNSSNLILYFPSSDQEDVDETLRNLEFVLPYRPLKMVYFWLGLGSPVWRYPENFGIEAVFNHRNYSGIFPLEIFNSMQFTIQSYRGGLSHQKKLWIPVKKKLKSWKKTYDELHRGSRHENILSLRDGRDFLIIRQKRIQGEHLTHRLEGTSRGIYLFCQKHRSLKRILENFTAVGSDKVVPFLRMMVDKKLMFEENNKYLSLAVPANPNS